MNEMPVRDKVARSERSDSSRSLHTSMYAPTEGEEIMVTGTSDQGTPVNTSTWPLPNPPSYCLPSLAQIDGGQEDNDNGALMKWIEHVWREEDTRANLLAEPEHILQQARIADYEAEGRYWHGNKRSATRHIALDRKHPMEYLDLLGSGKMSVVQAFRYGHLEMARKELQGIDLKSRDEALQLLMNEAHNMERSRHKHTVTLLGTLTWKDKGDEKFSILTSPVAECNLNQYLNFYSTARDASCRLNIKSAQKLIRATLGQAHYDYLVGEDRDWSQFVKSAVERRLDEMVGCLTTVVKHIHTQNIRHFDLKPDNIVLSAGELFITDFGISLDIQERTQSNTEQDRGRTPGFAAPEVEEISAKYSPASAEVYSLGCIFLHIAAVRYGGSRKKCKDVLDTRKTSLKQREAAIKGYLRELRSLPKVSRMYQRGQRLETAEPYLSLIERMLADDPDKRPSMTEVNESLHQIGGSGQIYYGSCCRTHQADHELFHQLERHCPNPPGIIDGYLAPTIYRRSKLESGFSLAWDAISDNESVLGKKHPDVLMSLDLLVKTLIAQEDFVPARKLGLLIMGRNMNALGRKHPDTIASMLTQAHIFRALGESDSAERLLRRAFGFRCDTYGRDHPLTLRSMDELAELLSSTKTYKGIHEAEQLLSEALEKKRRILGETYCGTLRTMHRLALVLCHRRRFSEAEKLLKIEASILEAQDSNHPSLFGCLLSQAKVYEQMGSYAAAVDVRRRIVQLKRILKSRLWGDDPAHHRYILGSPGQLSFTPNGELSPEEEEQARRDILKIRMEIQRTDLFVPDTLYDMHGLAQLLVQQGRSAEADHIYRQVLIFGMKKEESDLSDSVRPHGLLGMVDDNELGLGEEYTQYLDSSALEAFDEATHTPLSSRDDASLVSTYTDSEWQASTELARHGSANLDINKWLFNKLSVSGNEVKLLASILEAMGVSPLEDTAELVLQYWNSDDDRDISSKGHQKMDVTRLYRKLVNEGGFDRELVHKLLRHAPTEYRSSPETEFTEGGLVSLGQGWSTDERCGYETTPSGSGDGSRRWSGPRSFTAAVQNSHS